MLLVGLNQLLDGDGQTELQAAEVPVPVAAQHAGPKQRAVVVLQPPATSVTATTRTAVPALFI